MMARFASWLVRRYGRRRALVIAAYAEIVGWLFVMCSSLAIAVGAWLRAAP